MILTDKARMLLTPTYHVFEMYTVHHDATLLPAELTCEDYQFGQQAIPALSASASRDKAGKVHVTLCNLDPNASKAVQCQLDGFRPKSLAGRRADRRRDAGAQHVRRARGDPALGISRGKPDERRLRRHPAREVRRRARARVRSRCPPQQASEGGCGSSRSTPAPGVVPPGSSFTLA